MLLFLGPFSVALQTKSVARFVKFNFRDDTESLVVILDNIVKIAKFIIIFQVIIWFTHSRETKINISFNEQICFIKFLMDMVIIYMYVLLIHLLIGWKNSPGKAFEMLSLDRESLGDNKCTYWGLPGISRSDFLIVLDPSVTVETLLHLSMHLIFKKFVF